MVDSRVVGIGTNREESANGLVATNVEPVDDLEIPDEQFPLALGQFQGRAVEELADVLVLHRLEDEFEDPDFLDLAEVSSGGSGILDLYAVQIW